MPAHQVDLASKDSQVHLVHVEKLDYVDLQDQEEKLDHQDQLETEGNQALQDKLVPLDQVDQAVLQVLEENRVQEGMQELLDHRGKEVCQEHQDK